MPTCWTCGLRDLNKRCIALRSRCLRGIPTAPIGLLGLDRKAAVARGPRSQAEISLPVLCQHNLGVQIENRRVRHGAAAEADNGDFTDQADDGRLEIDMPMHVKTSRGTAGRRQPARQAPRWSRVESATIDTVRALKPDEAGNSCNHLLTVALINASNSLAFCIEMLSALFK